MFRIRVERLIDRDIEDVFDLLTDHEGYLRFPGVSEARVVEPGHAEKNGKGALRCIGAGPLKLWERITLFERPYRMDYRIEKAKPLGMRHEVGEIHLGRESDQTRAVWISEGTMTLPLVGRWLLDRQMEKRGTRAFNAILKATAKI